MTGHDLPSPIEVRIIAAALGHRYGGSAALRDAAALEQALLRPHLRRHPDVLSETAALLEGFEQQRPFAQGNHRVMVAVADVYLRTRGWRLAASPEQVAAEVVRMLRANAFDHPRLEAWLRTIAAPEVGA